MITGDGLRTWHWLGSVAPTQVSKRLGRELQEPQPERTLAAVRRIKEQLRQLGTGAPANRGYWLPVAVKNGWIPGGVIRLAVGPEEQALGAQPTLSALGGPDAQGYQARIEKLRRTSALSVNPGVLERLKPDGDSWTLAAEIALRAATENHVPSGRVVLTGKVNAERHVLPVVSVEDKARAVAAELGHLGKVYFVYCAGQGEEISAEGGKGLELRRVPADATVDTVWKLVLELEGGAPNAKRNPDLFPGLEGTDPREKDARRVFSQPCVDGATATDKFLNVRHPERSARVRIVTELAFPAARFEPGGLPGWSRCTPAAGYGWWAKLNAGPLARRSHGSFLHDAAGPMAFELSLGDAKGARLFDRGRPTPARLVSVDLVPEGPQPGNVNGEVHCALGFVLEFDACSLDELLDVTARRLAVWELALVPKRLRKWPQKVRLGALWTEIAGALAEGGAPGIPGVAVPRERLQRLTKPPVATVFQSAWLAPGPWTPPERLHAWDRFSGLHRRAQHDGAEVAAHWPTAEVRDIKSGCLYGHHSKAVSFLLDDDSEFAQDTKGTVLMESHYLQWLLARRRLAHGLSALTDEDLKAVFTESSHQKYLRWLEGALRGGPAAS